MIRAGLKIVWVYVNIKHFFKKLWQRFAIKSARYIPNVFMKKVIRTNMHLAVVLSKNKVWSRTTELSWLFANGINYKDLCKYWKKTTKKKNLKNAMIILGYPNLIIEINLEKSRVNYYTNVKDHEFISKDIEFNRIETKLENIIINTGNFGQDLLDELNELAGEHGYIDLDSEN